ncbi:MAG: TonB C-terminal domain-containing protein [Sulfurimonadaceae bacterium]|jgi:protein TonB|nr:TonB C-terminal domain-containing protein [Sulfurimonadaceae bacterium]
MDNNRYLITSGFISLALFGFVLGSFFYVVAHSSKTKIYALKKDEHISISLTISPEKKKAAKSQNKTIETPPLEIPQEELAEEKSEVANVQELNIDDMFSSVWTKDIKKEIQKEKKPDTKRNQEIAKRIKTIDTDTAKPLAKKVEEISLDKGKDTKNEETSSGNEVNEYQATIQALVYKHFQPPVNSSGHVVEAVIELSAVGKMIDFRIISKSSHQLLNEECDKIKNRLQSVLFPKSPKNKTERYVIKLIPEE